MQRDVDVRHRVEQLGPQGRLVRRLGLAVAADQGHLEWSRGPWMMDDHWPGMAPEAGSVVVLVVIIVVVRRPRRRRSASEARLSLLEKKDKEMFKWESEADVCSRQIQFIHANEHDFLCAVSCEPGRVLDRFRWTGFYFSPLPSFLLSASSRTKIIDY